MNEDRREWTDEEAMTPSEPREPLGPLDSMLNEMTALRERAEKAERERDEALDSWRSELAAAHARIRVLEGDAE